MRKYIIYLGVYVLLLAIGCSANYDEVSEQIEDNPALADATVEDNMVSENNTENGTEKVTENYFSSINDYNIINIYEALGTFKIPEDISREISVGNYSDKFPIELQNVLLHYNDDIIEGDGDWQRYEADCREVTREDIGDALYTELVEVLTNSYAPGNVQSTLRVIDIDNDGNDEYVLYAAESYWNHAMFILKNVEGQYVVINGGGDDRRPAKILNYEDNYYLLLDSRLACWNNEEEMPGLLYWNTQDVVLGQDDCWYELRINRRTINYTPYEIYSNESNAPIDYLQEVDLNTLAINDAEEKIFHGEILTGEGNNAHAFRFFSGWQLSYDKERYLYATGSILRQYDALGENDKMLAIMRQKEDGSWEIVKVYYLAANYDIQFEEL